MTPEASREFWKQHIAAWHSSGLSGKAYCTAQNISYHGMAYHFHKMKANAERSNPPTFVTPTMKKNESSGVVIAHLGSGVILEFAENIAQPLRNDWLESLSRLTS